MGAEQPWTDWPTLAATLAQWRDSWLGRDLFRASAGPGWLRLNLTGDERPGLLLTTFPGAALILACNGPLPEPLQRALLRTPKHPLTALLAGRTLTGLGLLPKDRVAALRFHKNGSKPIYILLQIFGSRGNTVVLDAGARLLWSDRKPPHSLLSSLPPSQTWTTGASGASGASRSPVDQVSMPALDHLIQQQTLRLANETGSSLKRQLAVSRRLSLNLGRDLAQAERGDEFRCKAETLAVHLHSLRSGMEKATLIDPRDGSEVEIELDPRLSPAENLKAWFRRARKADKGREVIRIRLEEAVAKEERLFSASGELEALSEVESSPIEYLGTLQDWITEHEELFQKKKRGRDMGGSSPASEDKARPFRRFLLNKRWEVWIGRNNKENDHLTFGASAGKDIWLHAQGVPGSHVILRTGGNPDHVPRPVVEMAASLAALHCRSKHSSLVPVIWTERRYVRKPRKSPPGTAACLREKNIFVEPGIPPGAEKI